LGAEYAGLALVFDDKTLRGRLRIPVTPSDLAVAIVVIITAGLLLRGPEARARIQKSELAKQTIEAKWIALHIGLFGVFLLSTVWLFIRASAGQTPVAAMVWLLCGALDVASLVRILAGKSIKNVATVGFDLLRAGLLLGLIGVATGFCTRPIWPWIAERTLGLSATLLRVMVNGSHAISVDAGTSILRMDNFAVAIAPSCSGVEGATLTSVFVAGYLYRYRSILRYPRAFLLVPIAVLMSLLANVLRISLLMLVGAVVSPQVALGGFHTQAGWLIFCLIVLGVAFASRRIQWFIKSSELATEDTFNPTAPYCIPLLALLSAAMATGMLVQGVDYFYPVRIVAGGFAVWLYRSHYRWPSTFTVTRTARAQFLLSPWFLGTLVFAIWIATSSSGGSNFHLAPFQAWSPPARILWWSLRFLGAVTVVPIVEELAFRGFLQRRIMAEDFTTIEFTELKPLAVAGSALAFGVLHQNWVGGIVAGIAYSLAASRRGDLRDAMLAHAVTNLLLAIWTLGTGQWGLWT
jgi:exosortase E/protease (VPEID-CTERM system)